MQMGMIGALAGEIVSKGAGFDQRDLERHLAVMYNANGLAAMVMERYPVVPFIKEYAATISEAVEAHFLGLDHVAVCGLIPVIEGVGRELANQRKIIKRRINDVFNYLATDCKEDVERNNIGEVGEIVSMLESFINFTDKHLYESWQNYSLDDNTNRHGILHGTYKDADYGTPLNFYKTIAAVDFLSFISSFRANISWFSADTTPRSWVLSMHYESLKKMNAQRKMGHLPHPELP